MRELEIINIDAGPFDASKSKFIMNVHVRNNLDKSIDLARILVRENNTYPRSRPTDIKNISSHSTVTFNVEVRKKNPAKAAVYNVELWAVLGYGPPPCNVPDLRIVDRKNFSYGPTIANKYKCPYCGKEFSSQEALNLHIAAAHPPAPPPTLPTPPTPPTDNVDTAWYSAFIAYYEKRPYFKKVIKDILTRIRLRGFRRADFPFLKPLPPYDIPAGDPRVAATIKAIADYFGYTFPPPTPPPPTPPYHKYRKITCPVCGTVLRIKYDGYEGHVVTCPVCGKELATNAIIHKIIKKGHIPKYKCPYCGKEFSSQEALNLHIAAAHPPAPSPEPTPPSPEPTPPTPPEPTPPTPPTPPSLKKETLWPIAVIGIGILALIFSGGS